jgi:putative SOS response-associated peptidase YedK
MLGLPRLPVVRQGKEDRELVLMQWGLIPWFSKDGKPTYSRGKCSHQCFLSRASQDTSLHRAGERLLRMTPVPKELSSTSVLNLKERCCDWLGQ